MHTVKKDSAVLGARQLFISVHCTIFELSEGFSISRLSGRLPPHDYTFSELEAHWKSILRNSQQ